MTWAELFLFLIEYYQWEDFAILFKDAQWYRQALYSLNPIYSLKHQSKVLSSGIRLKQLQQETFCDSSPTQHKSRWKLPR